MITLAIVGIFLSGALVGAWAMGVFITQHQAEIVIAAIRAVKETKPA